MMKLAHLQHRLDDLSTKPMLSAIYQTLYISLMEDMFDTVKCSWDLFQVSRKPKYGMAVVSIAINE